MDIELALKAEKALQNLSKSKRKSIQEDINTLKAALVPIIENEKKKNFKDKRKIKWSWNKFEPEVKILRATEILAILTMHEEAKKEVDYYERETQDILHAIELGVVTPEAEAELTKDLKEVRRYRRIAKDFIMVTQPLYEYVKAYQGTLKKIGQVHSETKKLIESLPKRTYTPREKTSLQEAFQKANQQVAVTTEIKD